MPSTSHVPGPLRDFGVEDAESLGIFGWDATKWSSEKYRDFDAVTAKDVLDRLKPEQQKPARICEPWLLRAMRLKDSSKLPPQIVQNWFPHDPGYIVPLYAAVKHKGLRLADIDFVIGGSILEMLAKAAVDNRVFQVGHGAVSTEDDKKLVCQRMPRVPGNAETAWGKGGYGVDGPIFVCKSTHYEQNFADLGFQFERYVTGQNPFGPHKISNKMYSLRLLKIGGFRILCCADVDARDFEGDETVEIKAGNPQYFGTKVMFQMLSNGAQKLVHANRRGLSLLNVVEWSFDDVVAEHRHKLPELMDCVVENLNAIARSDEVTDRGVVEILFDSCGDIEFAPCPSRQILPPAAVVRQLFKGC
eukprot:TRINITY_DN40467_c0_g1_i1.p1 TRINITY_DN40467_c0_g1~~TRINITY_DN40467_c0_g1_i1.p1  ORF type:complete len:360 (+),score=54.58 TRINITY_DN40467_c0_g1_i1:36-1115(+)